MDTDEIMKAALTAVLASGHTLRLGQAVYNAAYDRNPAVAHLAGTMVDPFNHDDRILAFLQACGIL